MYLNKIKLFNFKNYEVEQFFFNTKIISIFGNNGMGKTNLLDSIYFTCLGKSYFTSIDKNIVKDGSDFLRIESEFNHDSGESFKVNIKIKPGVLKEIELNEAKITKPSEFIGTIPVVIISPYDVYFLLQGNEERRSFVNNIIVQYDKEYVDHLNLYNKLLKQRNAMLKQNLELKNLDLDLFKIITERMAPSANYIYNKRMAMVEHFLPMFVESYQKISGSAETAHINYSSQLSNDNFSLLSDYNLEKDKSTGRSNIGIHKDEIRFYINGKSLKDYGSQGQIKSFVFALKLAQISLLEGYTGKSPILLLDDVFDKLDEQRIERLLEIIKTKNFKQVFITDTHKGRVKSHFDQETVSEIEISNGKIV